MYKILQILQYQELVVTEFDLEKAEEEELMNSMQSSMASVLWESTGATNGFDFPNEESLGEGLLLIDTKCRALATFSARCLRNLMGNSGPLGSLNLQLFLANLGVPEALSL